MQIKKKNGLRDTLVLTIITLVSGFLLSFIYQITKEPIEQQAYNKKMNAYKTVFVKADSFVKSDNADRILNRSKDIIGDKYGKVAVEEVLEAVDTKKNVLGYVITAYSDEGYGGRVKISMGYDTKESNLNKIEVLEASETAGLGAKISTPNFKDQFNEKKVNHFNLKKGSVSSDNEIQAISGATISSTAVTNTVNAVLESLGE